jgi:hypothetical protein
MVLLMTLSTAASFELTSNQGDFATTFGQLAGITQADIAKKGSKNGQS